MILRVGVDLVSIDRVERIYRKYRDRFLDRVFSAPEKQRFMERGTGAAALSARFAAKEAVLKAIGCGIGPAALNEVEITGGPGRQPGVRLKGEAARLAELENITGFAVSMSHELPFACAVAAAFGLPGEGGTETPRP